MSRVTNALVEMRFVGSIPPEQVIEICGEDDGTDQWYAEAQERIKQHVMDDIGMALDRYFIDEPTVEEVTM